MTDRIRLVLLFLFALLVTLSFSGLRMVAPLLAIDLGATPAKVGLLMSAFAILPALLSIRAGRWVDAAGATLPMSLCAALIAAGMLVLALAPELGVAFAVNAVTGLAYIVFHLALTAAVGGIGEPSRRTANFTFITVANGIGVFIGPVVAGHSIDALGHAMSSGILSAGPALVALVLGVMQVTRPRRPPRAPVRRAGGLRGLLRQRELVRILVIAGTLGISWDLYSVLVPVYGSQIGLSAGTIGNIMGAFGVAIFLVRLIMPFILRVLKEWQILLLSFALAAPVFIAFPLIRNPWVLTSLTFMFGIAWGAVQPVITSLLYTATPQGRVGEVTGLRMSMHTSLQTVVPGVFGGISALVGMLPVFWVTGAMLAGAGWVCRHRWHWKRQAAL